MHPLNALFTESWKSAIRILQVIIIGIVVVAFAYALLIPMAADQRGYIMLFGAVAGVYALILLRVLIRRFVEKNNFHYQHLTVTAILIFGIGLIVELIPALNLLATLYVAFAAFIGRRFMWYAIGLCTIVFMALDWLHEVSWVEFGLGIAWRTLIYASLGLLLRVLVDQTRYQWRLLAEEKQRQTLEVSERLREMQTLQELMKIVNVSFDLTDILNQIIERTVEILKMDAGYVALLSEEKKELTLAAQKGFSEELVRQMRENPATINQGLAGLAIQSLQPVVSADISADARVVSDRLVATGYKSFMCVPLLVRDGVVGLMGVTAQRTHVPDEKDLAFFKVIGEQLGVAIQRTQLYVQEQARRHLAESLRHIAQVANENVDLDTILEVILQELQPIVPYDGASIRLLQLNQLHVRIMRGRPAQINFMADQLWVERYPLYREVIQTKNMLSVPDTQHDARWVRLAEFEQSASWVGAPLWFHDEVIGVLSLTRNESFSIQPDELQLFATFAHQATAAIERSRLSQQARRRLVQLSVLSQVGQAINAALELPQVLQRVYEQVTRLTGARDFYVALYDPKTDMVQFPCYYEQGQPKAVASRMSGNGLTDHVIRTRQPLLINRNLAEQAAELGLTTSDGVARSWLGVPLLKGDAIIGMMAAPNRIREDAYDKEELNLFQILAGQVAQAIINARQFEAEQRRVKQLETIAQLGREIVSLLDYEELLKRSVGLIHSSFVYPYVHLFLVDEAHGVAQLVVAVSQQEIVRYEDGLKLRIGQEGLIGHAIQNRSFILENNVARNPLYYAADSVGIQSELVVPILLADRALGVLDVQSTRLNAFSDDDVFIMQTLADQLAIAISNAELHAKVERQARLDALTEVFNHGYFLHRLQQELVVHEQEKRELSLIMLDIDHFKGYNDRYGHLLGDIILRTTAQVIRRHIKRDDLVGRWGGEEFGVALLNTSAREALLVAERIRHSLATMDLNDDKGRAIPKPTVSQGIAIFPRHAQVAFALIDKADQMLYRAKNHGRDQVVIFEEQTT